jgi:diamine N-acetyltransferase
VIKKGKIVLRKARIIDFPKIYEWENNPDNWIVSETEKQYTFNEISMLCESAEDIFETSQLRLIIETNDTNESIGTLDFFQADFDQKSAHIGILIASDKHRRKGYAQEAIQLASEFCAQVLYLDKIYCTIHSFNFASLELFKKCGFQNIEEGKENSIFDPNSNDVIKMILWLKK